MTKLMSEAAKKAQPSLVASETGQLGSDNVVINHKRPPFDTVQVRRAISLAMDRYASVQAVRRLKLVWDIQRRLETDVARPMLGWRKEYFTQWPHVKNLVAHHSLYNWGRMQEVWLDK